MHRVQDVTAFAASGLEVRLVSSAAELAEAQALRYRVFYDEMGAVPDRRTRQLKRDIDAFDELADHIVVIDPERRPGRRVVGCYRLLRRNAIYPTHQFYTADEYNLSTLLSRPGEILELGRSCVDAAYRHGSVMQLLWRSIASYQRYHQIELMIGCASLPGTDIGRVGSAIGYLHDHHLAPLHLRPHAHSWRRVAHEPFHDASVQRSEILKGLPPLLRGYLRLGAMIGEGAVLDEQFNSIDVCIVMPTELIDRRYARHFGSGETPTIEA